MNYNTTFGLGSDVTFDEIVLYDFGGASGGSGGPTALPEALTAPAVLAAARYKEGRYYRESSYATLGDPGNQAAEWFSAPLSLGAEPMRIQGLVWTQIVPRGLRSPVPPGGRAGIDGDAGPDGRSALELVDGTGSAYLKDVSGADIDGFLTRDALGRLDRKVQGPFRLHAVFQPNLADPVNTAILDPLALDDVTLIYAPASGPRILSWGEGAE